MKKNNLPKALIIDIDGTLANVDHRKHFVERECNGTNCMISWDDNDKEHIEHDKNDCDSLKKDWDSFFGAMKDDTVNEWCRFIVSKCGGYDGCEIFLITGRPEKYRKETERWLMDNCMFEDSCYKALYMRPDDMAHAKDAEFKKKVYLEHIKDKYDVEFVIEDRQQCVDMFRNLGLTVLQCDVGDF
jgi:hypothetical protein